MKYVFLTIINLLIVSYTFSATKDEANNAGKSFAESMKNSISSSAKSPETDKIPHYSGENVEATQYYDDGVQIEENAALNASTDETSQYIRGSRDTRPNFTIDKDVDPLFKREAEIVDLSRSLTNTYSGCVALPVGEEDITLYDDKTCHERGVKKLIRYSCTKNLNVRCSNSNAGRPHYYSISEFRFSGSPSTNSGGGTNFRIDTFSRYYKRGQRCGVYTKRIQFYVADTSLITSMRFTSFAYDDWLDVSLNGRLVFRGVGSRKGTNISRPPMNGSCETGRSNTAGAVNAIQYIRQGWNTIDINNVVGGNGAYSVSFNLSRVYGCNLTQSVSYSCPTGESISGGTLDSESCLSSGYRTIGGKRVYRSCWRWNQNYYRYEPPKFTRDAYCSVLESEGCGQIGSQCIKDGGGFCEDRLITYSCPRVESKRKVDLCADLLSCPDGNCAQEYQTQEDSSEDFKRAATSLAVAEELAKQFDFNSANVFSGKPLACKRKALGIANCCKGSGWATDLGLASCDAEEKELGLARENKYTHYVGSYCSEKVIGACLATKHVYCSYPSKLARIVIEQGNVQIGKGYGSAKEPSCEGFTVEQLQSLDFNQMNLTEFYDDVAAKAASGTVDDPNQLIQDIADKLEKFGGAK